MKYLPIFLELSGRPCLVVGGGDVARRKVDRLLHSGAQVTVVAPQIDPALQSLNATGRIQHLDSDFQAAQLTDQALVIAATNDAAVNRAVAAAAQARNIPVNVADNPELCSFIMPSVIERDPVQIAISTGAASPVLARLLRARLETLIPSAYGRLADLMRDFREKVKARFADQHDRRRFWEEVLQGPIAEMLMAGQDKAALEALEQRLQDGTLSGPRGEVYLVGGGPGDPDLLTFRALRLMQQADVVLYDRLVPTQILELVRRDAERIYVGKARDKHTLPQDDINQLLVQLARAGKRVLRLKGGDPFIFGRGGEEIEDLTEAGVPFQVVPGITAAAGCASYAGIPLTHRDHAQSCIFVTGHMKDGDMDINWDALIQPRQTIVVYMGVQAVEVFCRELVARGMAETMPAALVQKGTTPQQRVYPGTLATLPGLVAEHDIRPPSLIIIGEVVRLHERLAWYKPVEADD
ncbi:uroporphyrin-III C-methyltransferase/precorrin-2 dehydrogenase/sirohydrochlorin ferrochelatase [Methylohalomonas lacus]|uniref:Siroheme synthase n=1 Tax=Methylohalomonas lacus TaxID=398773 RepID=A0AAE3L4Q7_9GAMM|nr:siroheme synthase CysG [Methylohalomonas lacus]MCS3904283.1 uroporphyrin-III C-methyltransferase/precorrin-2 dehydrogenase/sirohydrochlorin ferrochelatase [Methylohalomonas lacus]